MKTKKLIFLIMILVLSLLVSNSYAEVFKCKFATFGNENGHYKVTDNYQFNIVVAVGSEFATIIYKNNPVIVGVVLNSKGGINFVESNESGVIMTTIDLGGNVMQSKNIIDAGHIVPSQYYGTCEFFKGVED